MADGRERGASRRLGVGAVIVLVLAGLAITVGLGIARGAGGAGTAIVTPTVSATPGETPGGPVDGAVYVHVAGAVATPGLYRLSVGARAVDAIGAAGGFTHDADRAAVNLARTVDDGEQLLVPVMGASPPDAPPGGGADSVGGGVPGKVDLNAATVADLDTLPRIGPALAERIIAWRDDNGRFTSVDDLLSVPGIGEKIVEGLRDLVRV